MKLSPARIAALAAARLAKGISPETRKKWSDAGKRQKQSAATRKKRSENMSGEKNPMFGRTGPRDQKSSGGGQLLKFLNKEHEPYPKLIWEEEKLDAAQFGGELEEVPKLSADLTSVFPNAIEICQAPLGNGCTCGRTHAYKQSNISDEARATLNEILAEAEAEPSAPAVMAPQEAEPDEIEFAKGGMGERIIALFTQSASSIKMEELEWLWPDRVPAGKITLFVGKQDCGKSLGTAAVVAHVTTGSGWPDGKKNTSGPKEVVMGATEDDLSTTLVPRLKAAGADLDRIQIIKRVIVTGKKTTRRLLQLKEDHLLIKRMLRDHPGVALIVLDPFTGYFGDADANKDKEIRPVLEAIVSALEKSKCALIGIVHHNKKSDTDALGKIMGGSAVAGVARAAWAFSRDSENKEEFYMSIVKGNLSKKRSGMKYKIVDAEVQLANGKKVTVPRTEWAGETDLTADEVMAVDRDKVKQGPENTKQTMASLMVKTELESGPKLARVMYKKGEDEGISERTMKRACYSLNVIVTQTKDGYFWQLPKPGQKEAIAALAKSEDVKIQDSVM